MESFTEIGGIRFGRNYWWAIIVKVPFAKLSASPVKLKFTFIGGEFVFQKGEILRLNKYKGIIVTGIKIEHSNPKYLPFFVFWTFHFDEVKRNLEALGYEVNS